MTGVLQKVKQTDRWWIWAQNLLTLAALVLAPLTQHDQTGKVQIAIGIFFYCLGALIGILAVRDLGCNRSHHPQPLPDTTLVHTGIYSLMRHPLYTSLILLTLGWSIGWNSAYAWLASSALAFLLDQKARLEERYLTARFPEYPGYARKVKRFVPGLY